MASVVVTAPCASIPVFIAISTRSSNTLGGSLTSVIVIVASASSEYSPVPLDPRAITAAVLASVTLIFKLYVCLVSKSNIGDPLTERTPEVECTSKKVEPSPLLLTIV